MKRLWRWKGLWIAGSAAMLFAAFYAIKPIAPPSLRFTTLSGKSFSLVDFRGHPLLLAFWATTCPTCVEEMPLLLRAWELYHRQGFELLAVAMPYDRPDAVLAFSEKRGLPFPVVLDIEGKAVRAFGDVSVTPTYFFIDGKGRMVKQVIGPLEEKELFSWIEKEGLPWPQKS